MKYAPTSFNGQQSRAVLVSGSKHNELWDKITETHLRTLKGDSALLHRELQSRADKPLQRARRNSGPTRSRTNIEPGTVLSSFSKTRTLSMASQPRCPLLHRLSLFGLRTLQVSCSTSSGPLWWLRVMVLACRYVCLSVVDFWLGYLLNFV